MHKTLLALAITATLPILAVQADHGGVAHQGNYSVVAPLSAALPNRQMTPGATNPAVTEANFDSTICRRGGYTRTVRPPVSYTEPLKRAQIRAYGYTDHRLRDYEEDHLVPLEVGGAPSDPTTCGLSRGTSLGCGAATPRTSLRTRCTAWSATTRSHCGTLRRCSVTTGSPATSGTPARHRRPGIITAGDGDGRETRSHNQITAPGGGQASPGYLGNWMEFSPCRYKLLRLAGCRTFSSCQEPTLAADG